MLASSQFVYDEMQYPLGTYSQTHIARLGAIASLYKFKPVSPNSCRVLELGCAQGMNLIPMAEQYPDSEFVGVDYSEAQIKTGKSLLKGVGLKNLTLVKKDIRSIGSSLGEFDYIIAHGVVSWVPSDVRFKLLDFCRDYLSSSGIAYLSYNCFPAWHNRLAARRMVDLNCSQGISAEEKVQKIRLFSHSMTEALGKSEDPYSSSLRTHMMRLKNNKSSYVLHDEFEATNEPCYFFEFVDWLKERDLQYIGESEFHDHLPHRVSEKAMNEFRSLSDDPLLREQYADFLQNRGFRTSLICQNSISLDPVASQGQLQHLYFRPAFLPTENPFQLVNGRDVTFKTIKKKSFAIDSVVLQAVFYYLSRDYSLFSPFETILKESAQVLIDRGFSDVVSIFEQASTRSTIELALYSCLSLGGLDVATTAFPHCSEISSNTYIRKSAQLMARYSDKVVNNLHETVSVDESARSLLCKLSHRSDLSIEAEMDSLRAASSALKVAGVNLEQTLGKLKRHGFLCS